MSWCLVGSEMCIRDREKDTLIPMIYYFPSGVKSAEGFIQKSIPTGIWKNYYESGKLKSEGKKMNGKSVGEWNFYYPSGVIQKSIFYENNLKNGTYQQFDSLGRLYLQATYVNDTLNGKTAIFQAGKKCEEANYSKGKKNGTEKKYDVGDGRLLVINEYTNDACISSLPLNQLDQQQQPVGLWRTYYPDGKIASETFYSFGKKTYSKNFSSSGDLLNTTASISQKSDLDIQQTFYSDGKIKSYQAYLQKRKHGLGSNYDSTGRLICSFLFQQDTLIAKGFVLDNGLYDSLWQMYYPTGQVEAIGNYSNGVKIGTWKYFSISGHKIQEGKFYKGSLDGTWNWYYENGQLRKTESYLFGKREGISTEYDSIGNKIEEGNYREDVPDGSWYYFKNNLREEGSYEMGLKVGMWRHFYGNNTKAFEGKFEKNIPVGKHTYYYPSGKVQRTGKFKKGKKHQIWRIYTSEGVLIHSLYYYYGKLVSVDGDHTISLNED
jgi:antitoxin component YwqK of YwqJK toxin-antitoxin module